MTVNRRKKNVKQRGSHTHGWGSKKKHRGAGNRGGRGLAGTGKRADQKNQWVIKYFGKDYLGKRGFVSKRTKINAITIDTIEKRLQKLIDKKIAVPEKDGFAIDFTKTKYDKLLGTGRPTKKYNIKISYSTPKAREKIEKLGGSIVSSQ